MLITKLKFLITIFILIFTLNSFAQDRNYVKFITMEEAVALALKDNNLVKSSRYTVMQANWDIKRAWAELFHTLSFNTRYNWIDKQTFAERDFRQYLPPQLASQIPQTVFQSSYFSSFNVNLPIFNGVLLNGLSIAYEKESLAEQLSTSTKQQTIYNVIKSYLTVLQNKEIVKVQKEYLNLSKLNYEKAERLYRANRYSQNEALRWKIDLQQQKSTVAANESDLRSSLLSLGRLTNAEINSKTILDTNIPDYLEKEKNSILNMSDEEILNLVNLSNDELVQANAALSAAKSQEEISRLLHKNSYSSFMPKIDLSYTYGWRENNSIALDDYSPKNLIINFSLPIFSGFQNFTALKSSLYEYKKNQEEFKDQLLNTKLVLTNVTNNIINTKAQLELLKTNIKFSKNNYKIVERKRAKGLVSNIDYIDAKLKLQESSVNYINNSYLFVMSVVELYYLTGKIEKIIQ